ncbi:putative ribonuclease H-like domain-containing protein [Tanacetum coccineum]
MIGNKSYLSDYEEINGGFVAFGGDPKGGRITGKDFKLLDENHVLLRVPRKDIMYSVDLKNIVPSGGLTCLLAKATLDESNLWHRRLGHINFKTLNKLVRGNLVRGLPLKIFENNHTCVACRKGKQHKASCKFDGKVDERFFVGYFTNSKAYRVFNSRTRIVEENLHVKFSEEIPNIIGNEPNWLFDIDALTISMNYKPVVAGNQTNGNAGTKENIDAGQDGKKIVHDQKEEEKMDYEHLENEDSEVPNTKEPRINQEQDANVNNTNNINTVSPTVNVADIENNIADKNIVYGCSDDPNMPNLEEIVCSDDDEEVGAKADMNNLATTVPVSPIPTTRVHKDHPLIGDIQSTPQTRRMIKSVTEHVEPKEKVWTLVELPYGKMAIGTKWVYKNKKDDRGIVVRNKGRLVAQGYTQEEGIDYDEVFDPVARIEAIRIFLAYASFMNFIVYQMDVKSAFLYGTIEEEVYVCQPPRFEDLEFPNKVYKVERALYGLHQAPRAWCM